MKPNNATMHQSLTRLLLCVVLSVISISCLAAMTNHVRVEEGAKQYLLSQLTDNAQDTSIDVAIVNIMLRKKR